MVRSIGAQLAEPQVKDGSGGGQAQSYVDPAAVSAITPGPAQPPAKPVAVVAQPLAAPETSKPIP